MLLQVRARGETLEAEVALEGLLPCVEAGVPDQVADLAELMVAARVLARKRLHLVMDSAVLFQGAGLGKLLVADAAFKRSVFVVGPLVVLEGPFSNEYHITRGALIKHFNFIGL